MQLCGCLAPVFDDGTNLLDNLCVFCPSSSHRSPDCNVLLGQMSALACQHYLPAVGKEQTAKGGRLYEGRMFSRWLFIDGQQQPQETVGVGPLEALGGDDGVENAALALRQLVLYHTFVS